MKFYKLMMLALLFFGGYSYSMNFKLTPSDSLDGAIYFTLHINNAHKVRDVDIALEGNANNVTMRQYYDFSCGWGKAFGVRLGMDSATEDGVVTLDNVYALDSRLNILFAKSYSRMNNKWIDPINLNNSVCNRMGGGIKKDPLTSKDYIVDFESIEQGPFYLKGANNITIKYIRDDLLKLIRTDVNGENVVDSIRNNNNKAPFVRTVFFMKIKSKMNIVSLISWGGVMGEGDYYKVYAYIYDGNGIIHANEILNKDSNLSGYNSEKKSFEYKDANAIKDYILKHYGF